MKRLIAAASLAVLAVPAFAQGLPYEQSMVDRALPDVRVKAVDTERALRFGAPYDQTAIDRALPKLEPRKRLVAAFTGDTRSDVEIAATDAVITRSVWANDPNFIAPAQ